MSEAVLISSSEASRVRVRKHREALRAQGLRPIQIWVPDTRKPGFQEELDRQCAAVNAGKDEREVLEFIERSMDYSGWV
jgi:hypothetical protein